MFKKYKAFVFDLNGTMVNDMPYHIKAWHEKIIQLGGSLTLDEMKHQCYGKNDELLERVFPGKYSLEERIKIGNEKEAIYRIEFKPFLKLMDGLDQFLKKADQENIKMAIGSAAIMDNINFVIQNMHIEHYFNAIISANDVKNSKPDPETFLKCAEALSVAPADCLVFEDTPKGVECALNAGMQAVVILGEHEAAEFEQYKNVIHLVRDYQGLERLLSN
jgi:HAD superfamily hydrolase (TIGR01509 family)